MDLCEKGFRFIDRAGDFAWRRPWDTREGDVDCTDMDDDAFMAYVEQPKAPARNKQQ